VEPDLKDIPVLVERLDESLPEDYVPTLCSHLTGPVTRTLEKGQSILIKQGNLGVIYQGTQGTSDLYTFDSAYGSTLTAQINGLKVQLVPAGGAVTLCM
jgi:hypothetical protein